MPVLPEVGSTIVVRPGAIRPSASAASIIATPILSLTLPAGLYASSLPTISAPESGATRVRRAIGVLPTRSARLSGIARAGGDTSTPARVSARADPPCSRPCARGSCVDGQGTRAPLTGEPAGASAGGAETGGRPRRHRGGQAAAVAPRQAGRARRDGRRPQGPGAAASERAGRRPR